MRYVPSPTLRSMVVYGGSGLAFAGANLLLARALSTEHYGVLTLVVALITLAYHLAPSGLDALVTRGRVVVGRPLLGQVALAATAASAAFGTAAFVAYDLSAATAGMLLVSTVAGGLMLVAAAQFQAEQRFSFALMFLLSPNVVLLLGAGAVLATHATTSILPLAILTIGLVIAAAVSWVCALRGLKAAASQPRAVPWSEAWALAGVAAAGMLLIQLERLVIPYVLPLADLALFGVLGAIVGSLFRLLQMGVGFTLLPRLRKAADVYERRRLLAQELRLAAAIAVGGAAAILALTPFIERWFLGDKYALPLGLIIAAVCSGIAKIAHAFSKATSTALATPRELALVNGAGWVSAALGTGAAVIGAHWGLTGVVYGVGLGWLAWAALSFGLVAHHLRLPVEEPTETLVERT